MRSERIDLIVYSPLFVVNQTLIKEKGSHCQSAVAHRRLLLTIQRWNKTHKPDGEKQRLKKHSSMPLFFGVAPPQGHTASKAMVQCRGRAAEVFMLQRNWPKGVGIINTTGSVRA